MKVFFEESEAGLLITQETYNPEAGRVEGLVLGMKMKGREVKK